MKRLLACAALALLSIPAEAQVDRATVSGTVKDPTGAVLTTASIAVTHAGTNATTRVRTTGDGVYLVPNLAPGTYTITAEAQGFGSQSRAVILEVGQRARIDFELGGRRHERGRRGGGGHAPHQHHAVRGRHRDRPERRRQAAARDPQLGRHAGARRRRAGRPLQRGGRRHRARAHGRRQRPRQPVAAEQLPARRRRQQHDLDQRPGAVDAGLAPLDRLDRGVQGGHEPLLGRVRPLAGRRDLASPPSPAPTPSAARSTTTTATRSSTRTRTSTRTSARSAASRRCPSSRTTRTSSAAAWAARSSRTRRSSSPTTRARASRAASRASRASRRSTSGRESSPAPCATRSPASPSRATGSRPTASTPWRARSWTCCPSPTRPAPTTTRGPTRR